MQNILQIDKNVHYGDIVRHTRRDLSCRVSSLVEIYNETFGTDYSQRWWERMEKDNKLPTNVDRRLVIAAMLQIPFSDLGIKLSQTGKKPPLLPLLTGNTVIDVSQYRKHLALLWSSKYEKEQEAANRINLLEDALHYGPQSGRPELAELLCEYFLFWSNVERNYASFSSAFNTANKALQIAKNGRMSYIMAKSYYMRGYAAYEIWRASFPRNESTLTRVITDMGKASTLLKEAGRGGGGLEVAILDFWGGSAIHLAQDLQDKNLNLGKFKLAAKVLASAEKSAPPDPFFFKIDENWLHIGQAEALIAAKEPKSALSELGKVPTDGNAKKLRRFLTAAIVEADAYRAMNQIDMAAAHALAALETAKELGSDLHITTIDALYRDMRSEEKYKNSPELMRLGVEIVKARYPQFFSV